MVCLCLRMFMRCPAVFGLLPTILLPSTLGLVHWWRLCCIRITCDWLGYGWLVIHDPFIYVPNAMGLASAIGQLALFAKYGIQTPAAADPSPKIEEQ